jgi:hypothetical protein
MSVIRRAPTEPFLARRATLSSVFRIAFGSASYNVCDEGSGIASGYG